MDRVGRLMAADPRLIQSRQGGGGLYLLNTALSRGVKKFESSSPHHLFSSNSRHLACRVAIESQADSGLIRLIRRARRSL